MTQSNQPNEWLDSGLASLAMVQALTELLIERGVLQTGDMSVVADRAIGFLDSSGNPQLQGPAGTIRKLFRRP